MPLAVCHFAPFVRGNKNVIMWTTDAVNPLHSTLSYLIFHPLEVVSRYRDPQLQVGENYRYSFNLRQKNMKIWMFKHTFHPHQQGFNRLKNKLKSIEVELSDEKVNISAACLDQWRDSRSNPEKKNIRNRNERNLASFVTSATKKAGLLFSVYVSPVVNRECWVKSEVS